MSNFDFNKAIQGEPIYCNGERVNLCYDVVAKTWTTRLSPYAPHRWLKDGSVIKSGGEEHPLTTDPPKKKVKITVNLYKSKTDSTILVQYDSTYFPISHWYKCGETEIEVEG